MGRYNMLASQKFWQRLPEDIQETVIRNAKKFVPKQRAYVQAINAAAEAKLKDRGMIVVQPMLQASAKP